MAGNIHNSITYSVSQLVALVFSDPDSSALEDCLSAEHREFTELEIKTDGLLELC